MKKIYSNESIALIVLFKNYLEQHQIITSIRNEYTSNVMGEVAFFETWPELWILDESQYQRACQLIDDFQQATNPQNQHDWLCTQCQQNNPGNFDICWQCQTVNT